MTAKRCSVISRVVSLALILFWGVGSFSSVSKAQETQRFDVGEFADLSVLYAGYLDTPRERSFVSLLKSAFARVEVAELEKLDSASAAEFDVVVADWSERFKDGRFVGPQGFENRLGRKFTKPIVMVGAIGGRLPEGTKFNHL